MINNQSRLVFVDPPYKAYYEDRLFDHTDPVLNRDDTLSPFIRLREAFEQQGVSLHTADRLLQQANQEQVSDYYSLGVLENYEQLRTRDDVRLRAFALFEPPVVAPYLYRVLPELTTAFEKVYVHNIEGDGYSLKGVDQSKLRKLYWPQPYKDVLSDFWNREDRFRRIVMINGNHKPVSYNSELYSKRIEALAALSKFGSVDLYGRGWERWWSRSSMWRPYWRYRRALMSIYRGTCESKFETLSQYWFSLCFENMAMNGYVTEKIFDCLYAGTIPFYLGADDISKLVPENIYVDCRNFDSWGQIKDKILQMPLEKIKAMRDAGRAFIQSKQGLRYYDSLVRIFINGNH
jgi:hypothetical protein